MKAKVTIVGYYEVPDDQLQEAYGTTDPAECIALDGRDIEPMHMLELCDTVTMKIEVV